MNVTYSLPFGNAVPVKCVLGLVNVLFGEAALVGKYSVEIVQRSCQRPGLWMGYLGLQNPQLNCQCLGLGFDCPASHWGIPLISFVPTVSRRNEYTMNLGVARKRSMRCRPQRQPEKSRRRKPFLRFIFQIPRCVCLKRSSLPYLIHCDTLTMTFFMLIMRLAQADTPQMRLHMPQMKLHLSQIKLTLQRVKLHMPQVRPSPSPITLPVPPVTLPVPHIGLRVPRVNGHLAHVTSRPSRPTSRLPWPLPPGVVMTGASTP